MSNLKKYWPLKCRPAEADFLLEVVGLRGDVAEIHYKGDGPHVPDEDDWYDIVDGLFEIGDLKEYAITATRSGRHWDTPDTDVVWTPGRN